MKYEYGGVEYEGEDFLCYPGTRVLMNRFDIRDYDKLLEIEQEFTLVKIALISATPLKGAFNLKYLQKITGLFLRIFTHGQAGSGAVSSFPKAKLSFVVPQ